MGKVGRTGDQVRARGRAVTRRSYWWSLRKRVTQLAFRETALAVGEGALGDHRAAVATVPGRPGTGTGLKAAFKRLDW